MQNKVTERDYRFDALKGFAILIIILGHVIQYSLPEYYNTLVFNIIWSIQIPLFMVVSGYFSMGKATRSFDAKLKRRMMRYLIPFVSYFVLSTYISGSNLLDESAHLVWQLERSLWYVFVLFILAELNDIADTVVAIFSKWKLTSLKKTIIHTVVFFALVLPWLVVMIFIGSTFLGAKYIVYYSAFFWIGWMWRTVNLNLDSLPFGQSIRKIFVGREVYAVAFLVYLAIILRRNLYLSADTITGAIPRFIAGVCGVYILISFVLEKCKRNVFFKMVAEIGETSLELYYVHMLITHHIPTIAAQAFSPYGISTVILYFVFVLAISLLVIKLVKQSSVLDMILFGNLSRCKVNNTGGYHKV